MDPFLPSPNTPPPKPPALLEAPQGFETGLPVAARRLQTLPSTDKWSGTRSRGNKFISRGAGQAGAGKRELLFFMTAGQRSSNQRGDLSPGLSACVLKLCGLPSPQSRVTRAATGQEPPKHQYAWKVCGKRQKVCSVKSHTLGTIWNFFGAFLTRKHLVQGCGPFRWGGGSGAEMGKSHGRGECLWSPLRCFVVVLAIFSSLRNINL